MKDKWFRWEREASSHLLFPTLEAFYTPLFKYSGVPAPTMVLVFKKGVVTWCIEEDAFMAYGRNLLRVYSDPKKEKKMVSDIKSALQSLKKIEAEQEKLDLKKLSNKDLVAEHKKLYSAFLSYYTMGAIGTPLSFAAETDLNAKGLSGEQLHLLTTPKQISYVAKADAYLEETKNIKGFIQRYFWVNNNYSGTEILSETKAKERLQSISSKEPEKARAAMIKSTVKLSASDRRAIELLKYYSAYKDDRKKEILIYLHYIDRILCEVARRMNFSIEEVRASCPFEIESILSGKLSRSDLQKRFDYSVIVWQEKKDKAEVYTGTKAKKWEAETFEKVQHDIKEIKGTTASLGKIKGKVRILLKAGDSDQIQRGEILVTFMTSPDFMPAIRKCAAIVTNLGGVTCHAAIISRELKLPCIVGTKIATKVLKTGDLVEVDANNGVVTIL